MRNKDWLLMLIGSRIEPIQIQKAMFKFAQEGRPPVVERYKFVPYNWGPCSMAIYSDLERLRKDGLVAFEPSGRGWNAYRVTASGEHAAQRLREKAPRRLVEELDRIREWVVARPFNKLLTDVYDDYPQFATKSFFER